MADREQLTGMIEKYWAISSTEKRLDMIDSALDHLPHKAARDFVVADVRDHPALRSRGPVLIVDVTTGKWCGFNYSYKRAKYLLDHCPEEDRYLKRIING